MKKEVECQYCIHQERTGIEYPCNECKINLSIKQLKDHFKN